MPQQEITGMKAIAYALGMLLTMAAAIAAAEPAAKGRCGPYSVGVYSFGAFYYRTAQGQPTGIDPDLIEALAARSGCQLDPELESRARIWARMAQGLLDISLSAIATPDREQYAEFVPYMRSRNEALMRRELAARYPTAESFAADPSRTVLVVRSFKHGPSLDRWIEALRRQHRVVDVGDFETGLRALQHGRADLIFAHPLNLEHESTELMQEMVLLDWAPQDTVQAGLAMSRTRVSEIDRQRLREALRSLLRDGSVERILHRHLSEGMVQMTRLDTPPATAKR